MILIIQVVIYISIWEISMFVKRNRLTIDTTASNFINLFLQSRNIQVQSITPEIAELSVNFSSKINNDPADRLILATANELSCPLVSKDRRLREYKGIEILW